MVKVSKWLACNRPLKARKRLTFEEDENDDDDIIGSISPPDNNGMYIYYFSKCETLRVK